MTKKLFIKIGLFCLMIFLISLGALAAEPQISTGGQQIINGVKDTGAATGLISDPNNIKMPAQILGIYINGILNILGVLFLVLVIYGGVLWMTAAGSEEKVRKAKAIIINAAIGLTIILLAKAITFFVLELVAPTVAP